MKVTFPSMFCCSMKKLVGVRRAWRRKRVAGRKNARGRCVDGFLVPVLWDKLEISSRRSLRCRKKPSPESSPESSPEKLPAVSVFWRLFDWLESVFSLGYENRDWWPEWEREREMIGLRYGQKDLAGMSDGLNKRWPEGIRVSENWLWYHEEFLNSFIDNESVHTIHIYIHKWLNKKQSI